MKTNLIKKVIATALIGSMVFSLAGCGSEEETIEAAASEATVIKVGTGNSAAPFCYLDEDGNSVGYDIDVLAELDERLEDYEFQLEVMDFPTLIVSIDSGAIDMISHQLVKSEARKEKYLFPEQYYCLSPMSLCVGVDSGINSLADMAGKTIDQNPSAYEYQMLMSYNAAHPGEEMIINAVSDQTTADGYKKVANGLVDAALTYQSTFETVNGELGLDTITLTDVVLCEDTYMMFSTEQADLVAAVDAALADMLEDGTLSEISMKWYDEDVFEQYADMIQIVAED